jgi:hypothetical protein
MRFLLVALMATALAACDLGASSPSAEPLPSVGAESGMPSVAASASASTDASVSAAASASTDASSATSMTCQEAFTSIDVTSLEGMTSLDAASDVLDDTIAACGDVTEWQTALTALVPGVDVTGAEAFLAARCDENDLIDDSPICEALDD